MLLHAPTSGRDAQPVAAACPPPSRFSRLVRALELPALRAGFVLLATALVFGRVSLPPGLEFGYRSCARNVALLFVAFSLAGGARRTPPSRIGPALAALLLVATASLAWGEGGTGNLRVLASALGVFYAARRVADAPGGTRWLWHLLGLVVLAVLAREVWHAPAVLSLREAQRLSVVTENPNTLGFLAALLTPLFLARTPRARDRCSAWLYAASSSALVLVTYSRAAWIGLVLGASALALGAGSPPRRAVRPLVATTALALALIAVATISAGRTVADAQRTRIVATSLSLFREHWPFGIGFGAQSLERMFPQRHLELHGESLFLFHSHNLLVDALVGTGVAGFAALVVLLLALARTTMCGLRSARGVAPRSEALGYAVACGVYVLLGMADTPLYHGRIVLVSALVWAMTESAQMRSSTSGAHKSSSTRRLERSSSKDSRGLRPAPGLLTSVVKQA